MPQDTRVWAIAYIPTYYWFANTIATVSLVAALWYCCTKNAYSREKSQEGRLLSNKWCQA